MSDKVTVDIAEDVTDVSVTEIPTSVTISDPTNTITVEENTTTVNIAPVVTTVNATEQVTTVDISENLTTVGIGDASIVASNLASTIQTNHDSGSWVTGASVQASFDNLATTADSRYVNVTGDTMTGQLIVPRLKVERDNGTAVISLHDNTDDDDHVIYLTGMVDTNADGTPDTAANIFSLGTNDTTNQFQMHSWLNRDFEFTFGSDKHVDAVATISTSGLDINGNADVSGNFIVDTDTLYVDSTNNRVGINTTNPLYALQAVGSIYANAGSLYLDTGQRLKWGNSQQFIEATNSGPMEFGTGNAIRMVIKDDGNVGIGNNNPSTALDVTGTITGTGLDINGDGDISNELVVGTKVESPLFKGDLEGAVHFKATDSGTTLAKGDVVYITGYQGQRTTVDKADASNSAKMPAFGIVNAVTGSNVDVLTFGSMLSLSTTGIATGTELYVSATTPGGYETFAPTGEGNLIQKIAKVVKGDSNSGSIKIMGAGRTNATPNLNDGNIFIGNSSNIPTTASFDTTVGTYISGDRTYGDITTTGKIYGPSTLVIDPSPHDASGGNVKIEGSLIVNGTTTQLKTQSLDVQDNVISLNRTGSDITATTTGFSAFTGTGNTNATILFNTSNRRWTINDSLQVQGALYDSGGNAGDSGNVLKSTGEGETDWGRLSISDLSDVNTTNAANDKILKYSSAANGWVVADDAGGIALTDLSVSVGTAGTANLSYNNASGTFTYTPPDLSSYLTTVAFSDLTSTPTTISGYGITDAFDGAFSSLTSTPTTISGYGITDAFDGAFSSLTSTPTTISGYGITDALALGTDSTTALAGDSGIEDLSNVSSSISPGSNSVLAYNSAASEYQPYLLNDVAEIENQYIEVSTGAGVVANNPYYASAYDGANNRPIVALTDADNEQPCIGIATETVGSGSVTKLLTKGIIRNIDTTTTAYPGTGNLLYISSVQGQLTRTAPVAYQKNLQQVATVLSTHATTGAILVDITASQVGVANLPHTYIAYGGPNGEQIALYDDVSLPIRASAGPSGSREYWNVLRLTDANGNYTGDINHIQIGQAEADEDKQLVDKISLFPGANGVRIHNSEAIGTEGISGQTLAFHTTDDGIHVGNDRRGTYTAGDLMVNDDTDFGMLAGSQCNNYGRNNFGFGFDIDFNASTNENFSAGARNTIRTGTSNSVAFGGSVRIGDSSQTRTEIFGGGFNTKTTNDYGFSWGYGFYSAPSTEYFCENDAKGGVLFGHETVLTANATNSFVGGAKGGNTENWKVQKVDSENCFNYGKGSQILSSSDNSGAIGLFHELDTSPQSFVAGEVHRLDNTQASAAVGALHTINAGDDYCFAAGYSNEVLGNGGACIGYELKTPLNNTGTNPYEWEDYCTVVGGYNDEAKKFDTDDGVGATWVQNQRFVVGTGTDGSKKTGFVVAAPTTDFSGIIMTHLAESTSHATPADARDAGVPTGGLYRTGNDVKILLAGD